VARKAVNNPRQIRVKSCTCKLCIEAFHPGEKPTRKDCTGTWQARYRDPSGKQRSRNFPTKTKAEAFLDAARSRVRDGSYIDQDRSALPVAQWYDQWRPAQRAGETTTERNDGVWKNHVEPQFGSWPLKLVGHLDVDSWIAGLTKVTGTPTIIKAFQLLDRLMAAAVRDRRILHNPCDGIKLPRQRPKHPDDAMPPTYEQLAETRKYIPAFYHPLLIVAEETGLRWGELAGLRRRWVDFADRSIQVREVVIEVHGKPKRKAFPKSDAGSRTVPMTDRAMHALKTHLDAHPASAARTAPGSGLHAEELVFRGPKAGTKTKAGVAVESVLKRNNIRRLWVSAITQAGILREVVDEVTERKEIWPHFHDIRHAFASRLHALGVSEADAQKILGHERGGKITWLYTHAGADAVDTVRAALGGDRPGLRIVADVDSTPSPHSVHALTSIQIPSDTSRQHVKAL
jgi:integrase